MCVQNLLSNYIQYFIFLAKFQVSLCLTMPKKRKSSGFKGIPWHKMPRIEDDNDMLARPSEQEARGSNSGAGPSQVGSDEGDLCRDLRPNPPVHPQQEPVSVNTKSTTTSEKKLKSNIDKLTEECANLEGVDHRTGYRLIDLECLNAALKCAHRCEKGYLQVVELPEKRRGLCSKLKLKCYLCHE
ncbi:uncharacterized protein LOC117123007 [Anneissia japonica]|uniref:uncharacterized protein LOC117123007 n=1 Tax=Anneissia japonica TaxID=1529436 RepID=UPI0014255C3A|nr:uncharacterized protein LOC117123007 [Anneissia japonica]